MQRGKLFAAGAVGTALVASTLALSGTGNAAVTAQDYGSSPRGKTVQGQLNPLNNSGVTGHAVVGVKGTRLHVKYVARNLAEDLPHAAHIHFGDDARHECPTVADDTNGDFRLTTLEGQPAYGPIVKSLTTSGDTSPDSALAVIRFSTAPNGTIRYTRVMFSSMAVAKAIKRGEGDVVVHGVDDSNNDKYDFDSAGASDLTKTLPAEATDPAACGVLHK